MSVTLKMFRTLASLLLISYQDIHFYCTKTVCLRTNVVQKLAKPFRQARVYASH